MSAEESASSRTAEIRNLRGLHARAAARFVKCASQFQAEVTVRKDNLSADGKSMLGLMALSASLGTVVLIEASGPEAAAAVAALGQLIDEGFGEER
ncbi:MAG: HPr family phosphocarrier protein [Rhodospirillales bacterium]|nr:HPr family phosphocarrier protein [Rhodospirillales bacterium]MDE0712841.1 HPr family phosphocarrier protein [Rhodospirillales bacterium]